MRIVDSRWISVFACTGNCYSDSDSRHQGQKLRKQSGSPELSDLRLQGALLFVNGRQRVDQDRSTTIRVPVLGKVTVCSSRASKTWSIKRWARARRLDSDLLNELAVACFPQCCHESATLQKSRDGRTGQA